jgi:SecD/SecF fusion protein
VDKVRSELQQIAPGADVRRVEVVGASIGSELFRDGLMALALAGAAMFVYIAFRFEWPFAVGAVVTMFLDLTKTVGFFALTGIEFDLTSIAAILAIMGFSINDKIVVYDRVRENLRLYKQKPLREVIDLSINETLARTVATSIAHFLAIAPLALFGGPALNHFALTLLFGLVLATSSSIFIAAPILLNLGEQRLRRSGDVKPPELLTAGRTHPRDARPETSPRTGRLSSPCPDVIHSSWTQAKEWSQHRCLHLSNLAGDCRAATLIFGSRGRRKESRFGCRPDLHT